MKWSESIELFLLSFPDGVSIQKVERLKPLSRKRKRKRRRKGGGGGGGDIICMWNIKALRNFLVVGGQSEKVRKRERKKKKYRKQKKSRNQDIMRVGKRKEQQQMWENEH